MPSYSAPTKRVHRGFVYLDDATVINSLSALESGKIDEVVRKVNQAREGGAGGGLGLGVGPVNAKVEGGRKSTLAFEEEVVRTRTRFSIFELWYQTVIEEKALGTFEGWGDDVLEDVLPGDTIEIRGELSLVPLQTLLRLFRWFGAQAQDQASPFAQRGEELKATKGGLRVMEAVLGGVPEVLLDLVPLGGAGPRVAVILDSDYLIGRLGRIDGVYSVVAQVEIVLDEGDTWPTVRLTGEVPVTPLEQETLRETVENLAESAADLGVSLPTDATALNGPAVILRAIAVYR